MLDLTDMLAEQDRAAEFRRRFWLAVVVTAGGALAALVALLAVATVVR